MYKNAQDATHDTQSCSQASELIPRHFLEKSNWVFFYFSSRRWHTRSKRDWRSDVCSSDLLIARSGESDASVLIHGETGTGKELVGRGIHMRSRRKDGPFVAINCAAVPHALLESELFGHARGAFTDAKAQRTGLFVQASGGTLFLDEIGELPVDVQPKLLRALQERKVRPVGANHEIPFDARIVAATNRNLEDEVYEKRFRKDLYYRINVVKFDVPPLRERGGDVLHLSQH